MAVCALLAVWDACECSDGHGASDVDGVCGCT